MRLMFVGDISLGEHYFSFGHGPRTVLGKQGVFQYVKPLLSKADFTVGNLEGPISDIGSDFSDPESMVFRGEPSAAAKLRDVGFDYLCMANNHSIQHGEECFQDTAELLKKNNITPLGLANEPPVIAEKDGVKIAFLTCSQITDNTYEKQSFYQGFDIDVLKQDVNKIREEVSWIILNIHWGLESKITATSEQIDLANCLHEIGIDIIVGHHPHIFYEIYKKKNKLVAYSLGNFVFDLPWDNKLLDTGILEVKLTKDAFEAKVHPVRINKKHQPVPYENAWQINSGLNSCYSHKRYVDLSQVKKLVYFIMLFFKGKTALKWKFIKAKIIKKIIGKKHA